MHIIYQDYLGSLCEFSSETFHAELSQFGSWQGRVGCLRILMQKILCLPFGLLFKFGITLCRAIGVLFGFLGLVVGFSRLSQAREYFTRRFVLILLRLLLGCFVHPALYFR
jgi:uncharacterized membrane protein